MFSFLNLGRQAVRVKVFINPYSGRKKGPSMWKSVEALFETAQMAVEVISTISHAM